MRRLGITKSTAVTLFEMLLVLFVSSMVAVSAVKYQQQERLTNIAEPMAQRMYLYAQTVREFVAEHQAEIAAGTLNPFVPPLTLPAGSTFSMTGTGPDTVYKFTGITWLQTLKPEGSTTTYLPKIFTFSGLTPLELRRGNLTSDAAIEVQISTTKVTILYGALYNQAGDQALVANVTALAATKANKLYDPLLGISSFHYVGGVDKNGTVIPITATWEKSQTEEAHLNSDTNVGGDLGVGGDINVKPDGTDAGTGEPGEPGDNSADITGVGTLAFDRDIANAIVNLDKINFSLNGKRADGKEGGEIDGLGDLYMVGDGDIEGVGDVSMDTSASDTTGSGNEITGLEDITFASGDDTTIAFPPQGGVIDNVEAINFVSGGDINNIDTLNFDRTGAGKLTQVQSIEFKGGKKFEGFKKPINWFECAQSDCDRSASRPVNTGFDTSKYICTLSIVRLNDGDSGTNRACKLVADNFISQKYIMNFENALGCGMLCFQYSE